MMKIYIVTTGSYSDYSIRGVFSTKKLAQQYMDNCQKSSEVCWHANDFNTLEEYVLNSGLEEKVYTRWFVGIMLDDGSLEYGRESGSQEYWGIPINNVRVAEKIPAHNGRGAVRAESCKSAKHALKLAVEKRQEYLRIKKP